MSDLITAAQLDRGMRVYSISFVEEQRAPGEPRFLATSFMALEDGALVLLDVTAGVFRVGRVYREELDLSLSRITGIDAWVIADLTEYQTVGIDLRKEEQAACRRLTLSMARREAKQALAEAGIESSTALFAIENKEPST